MRRLAVVGASGFIGRHVVSLAVASGLETIGVVRSKDGAAVVRAAGGRPVSMAGFDETVLAGAFEGAQAVVHLAHIGAEREGRSYEAVNVEGTRRVASAATRAGVPRVILFSGLGVARYGMAPRSTNPYFLSKLAAEVAVFRAAAEAVVFRPSYVVGPQDGFVRSLLGQMESGEVQQVGDGGHRLQPIAVRDAAEAVLAAVGMPIAGRTGARHRVFDLVGPVPVSFRDFVEALGKAAQTLGRRADWRVRATTIEEADRQASDGGWRGMGPDELDCLLCDEVADARPLEALLGRFLTPLEDALVAAVRGTSPTR